MKKTTNLTILLLLSFCIIITLQAQEPGTVIEQGSPHEEKLNLAIEGGYLKIGDLDEIHLSIDKNSIQTLGKDFEYYPNFLHLNKFGGEVGINLGNSFPNSTLDVNGSVNIRQGLLANGIAGTTGQLLSTDANGNLIWTENNDDNWIKIGNYIYNNSDRVGIGIGSITPSTVLEIASSGNSHNDSGLAFRDNNANRYNMYKDQVHKFYIGFNGAKALTIDPSGNLGIGNVNPNYKLDVNGDINTDNLRLDGNASSMSFYNGSDYKAYLQSFGSTMSIVNRKNGNLLLSTNNQSRLTISGNGNVGIGTGLQNIEAKLKIINSTPTSAGLLIENSAGAAHNWIPYTDGGVYLTADNSNNQFARFTLRGYNTNGYTDWVTIASDEATFDNRIRTPWIILDHYNQQGGLVISGTNNSSAWRIAQDQGFSNDEPTALKFWFGGTLPRQIEEDGDWILFSDKRMKANIKSLSGSQLKKILNIKPSQYNYINQPESNVKFGFIAQDVDKEFPELVSETASGMLGVNYEGFIPLLTASIQEQQKIIDHQQKTISDLSDQLSELSIIVSRMNQELKTIKR